MPPCVLQYNKFLNLIASPGCHCNPDRPYTATVKDDSFYFVVIVGTTALVPMQKDERLSATPSQPWARQEGRRLGLSSVPGNGEL